jgi:hypothetical protein
MQMMHHARLQMNEMTCSAWVNLIGTTLHFKINRAHSLNEATLQLLRLMYPTELTSHRGWCIRLMQQAGCNHWRGPALILQTSWQRALGSENLGVIRHARNEE